MLVYVSRGSRTEALRKRGEYELDRQRTVTRLRVVRGLLNQIKLN